MEDEFRDALVELCRKIQRAVDHTPSELIAGMNELGASEVVRRIIHAPRTSATYGLLAERGRLDLTVEALVLSRNWGSLFDQPGIDRAQERVN